MNVKQLQGILKGYSDDFEIFINTDGTIYKKLAYIDSALISDASNPKDVDVMTHDDDDIESIDCIVLVPA